MNPHKVGIRHLNLRVLEIRVGLNNKLNIHNDIGLLPSKQSVKPYIFKKKITSKIIEWFKGLQKSSFCIFHLICNML